MKVKEEERRGKRKEERRRVGFVVFVAVLCAYVFCEV
jgi:hypothetical protein